MIRFRAFRTNFSLPLLTLLFPFLAGKLGMNGAFPAVPIALCLHELAHLLAAKALRVEIREIQLTPFGGAARIANPYKLPALRMLIIALAGPLANLLLLIVCAALAQWQVISLEAAQTSVQINLFMMLFNLLPALPLDGGRILYCILQRPMGESRALRFCLMLGRILSILLCALSLFCLIRYQKLNLTFLLAAIFIFSSIADERDALSSAQLGKFVRAISESTGPQRMQLYQVNADLPAQDALQLLRPNECAWLLLMQEYLPYGLIDGRGLITWLAEHDAASAKLSDLPCFLLAAQQNASAI